MRLLITSIALRMNANLLSVLVAATLSITFQAQENSMNALFVIAPYFKHGTWVFTDERRNLVEEPFVAGVPEIITEIAADIPNAKAGFRLTFSAGPFPGHEVVVTRAESESGGYWYYVENSDTKGWLCPALFKFFPEAPAKIYVRADPLPGA
jgi:hypothetical protein